MNKLTESRYNYENGMMSSAIATSRAGVQIDIAARSGTTSTLGTIVGGVSAGAQGYSVGKSIGSNSSSNSNNTGGSK
jgi:hypothetical protein